MRPTGPVRALAGLPRAAERQIIGTRKQQVIRGIPGTRVSAVERDDNWHAREAGEKDDSLDIGQLIPSSVTW